MKEPQSQCLTEERHSHAVALQTLERQAKEDLLSERNRLQTMHHLELGTTHTQSNCFLWHSPSLKMDVSSFF